MTKSRQRGNARARAQMRLPKTVELGGVITKENGVAFASGPNIRVTQLFDELRRSACVADFSERYRIDPREIDTVLRAANLLIMESFTGKRLLSGVEVVHQLRRALSGEVVVRLADPRYTWDGAYCGNCHAFVGDWEFWFYNDAGKLDYIDTAIAPDGRWSRFDEFEREEDPLFGVDALLSESEQKALERLLEKAK